MVKPEPSSLGGPFGKKSIILCIVLMYMKKMGYEIKLNIKDYIILKLLSEITALIKEHNDKTLQTRNS